MDKTLFAPWRLDYIKTVADGPADCFLCSTSQHPDKDATQFVIARGKHCLLMLNRYPYVNGHLLAAPYRHVSDLTDLSSEERCEMFEFLTYAEGLLKQTVNPQGFNLGVNLGKCAGAGVPGHVHAHLVPRWNGDINFMSVVAQIKIIPQALESTYELLKAAHERHVRAAP